MNSIQIEYFLALAEHLSFSETARHIHVSQPAISKQITALEQEMGITLFERSYRHVKLTGSGKLMREYFLRVSGEYDALLEEIHADYDRLNALIRIGCIPNLTLPSLPKAIRNFGEHFPKQGFHFKHAPFHQLLEELEEGELDLIIGMDNDIRGVPGVVWRTVDTSRPMIIFSKDHPLAGKEDLTLLDFKDETFISVAPQDSSVPIRIIGDVCSRAGFTPRHLQHYGNSESVFLSVESCLGVTVVHESMMTSSFAERFHALGSDYTERVVAAWKRNTTNDRVEIFIQELLRHVDKYEEEAQTGA